MRAEAIAEGERFIAAEQALEDAFRRQAVTEERLHRVLGDIERSRARLRFIHLVAHLGTPELLTDETLITSRRQPRNCTLRNFTWPKNPGNAGG